MMTDRQILLTYAGRPLEALPEDILRRVERRPRLRAALEQQARVAACVSLKRFEVRDPAAEGRLSHRLLVRIRAGDIPWEAPSLFVLPEWARMLAVVLVMLGLSLLIHREMLVGGGAPPDLPLVHSASPHLEVSPLADAPNPMVLHHLDPFTTFVELAPQDPAESPAMSTLPGFQDDPFLFPPVPGLQTNRFDRSEGFLPVRQSFP